jgi:hypothetical protein
MELYTIDTIAVVRKRIALAMNIPTNSLLLVAKGKRISD